MTRVGLLTQSMLLIMKSSHSASFRHHFRTCCDREHHVFTHFWLFFLVRKFLLKRCMNRNGGVYLLCEFNFRGDKMKPQRQLYFFFQCCWTCQFKFSITQGPNLLFVNFYLVDLGVCRPHRLFDTAQSHNIVFFLFTLSLTFSIDVRLMKWYFVLKYTTLHWHLMSYKKPFGKLTQYIAPYEVSSFIPIRYLKQTFTAHHFVTGGSL